MNSWDKYYKEFKKYLDGTNPKFCICIKDTEENEFYLQDLGYKFAEDAETIHEVKNRLGQYAFHTYEDIDFENDEVKSVEDSIEIYHEQIFNPPEYDGNWMPNKDFIEKWFGIKKEIILGVQGGF